MDNVISNFDQWACHNRNLKSDKSAYRQYMTDINNSEGFYITPNKDGSVIFGGVRPVREYSDDRYLKAEQAARFTVEEHNMKIKEGEKGFLEFLKIVNLNVEPTAGRIYYITMAVFDGGSGEMSHYQAKVWEAINTGFKVQIFRLAPYCVKSSDKLANDFCCVRIDNLMPWMNESYLYYNCFVRIRRHLLGLEINHKESGGSEGVLWFRKGAWLEDILKIYIGETMPLTENVFYSFDF
ncbi:hypothetical protein CASFOL_039806 [Castilleja foliolosa]|uniref:Cysteine proteinase inhibitor n=1 Tax=Castilleja foliolosa TaxID=1961234 RepID=A0ABD3BG90_9LAMI